MDAERSAAHTESRVAAFDKSDCPNGPDEHGDWPCDPKVLFGGREAECQACGRVAAWPATFVRVALPHVATSRVHLVDADAPWDGEKMSITLCARRALACIDTTTDLVCETCERVRAVLARG